MRHGLEDESSRLNLNVLLILDKQVAGSGRTLLMGLPGMTEDVADAILDWLDPDDEPRELGCEVEYYSGLSPPYAAKNGPVDTVEELLLVRGVTPQLLFGCDINRNGQLDQNELLEENTGAASTDPSRLPRLVGLSHALQRRVEHHARWQSQGLSQHQRPQQLVEDLAAYFEQDRINFIVAYRQAGSSGGGGGGGAGGARRRQCGCRWRCGWQRAVLAAARVAAQVLAVQVEAQAGRGRWRRRRRSNAGTPAGAAQQILAIRPAPQTIRHKPAAS